MRISSEKVLKIEKEFNDKFRKLGEDKISISKEFLTLILNVYALAVLIGMLKGKKISLPVFGKLSRNTIYQRKSNIRKTGKNLEGNNKNTYLCLKLKQGSKNGTPGTSYRKSNNFLFKDKKSVHE